MKVRLYGHIGKLSGYGRASCDLAMSLLAAGVELDVVPISNVTVGEGRAALARYMPVARCIRQDDARATPDAVIVHTLPLDCARFANSDEITDFANVDVPIVAYTTWEGLSDAPTEVIDALAVFNQIWTPGHSQSFARQTGQIVCNIPHAFDPESLPARRSDVRVVGNPFRCYYLGAWNSRKNPAGLLRAWATAFMPDDHVELVLRSAGASPEQYAVALHQTGIAVQSMAPVVFDNTPLTDAEMLALHAQSDCFVTATRGEAWNLPAFDAMLAGRHVIHPAGMGSDDYLRDTSALLYGGMAVPASVDVKVTGEVAGGVRMQTVGAHGISSRSTWMEPDLLRLAENMRNVYLAKRRDLSVRYDPAERYSYAAVGKRCMTALEDL